MKRRYRIIDFKRNKDGVPAKVATIEYDPNRTARIALLHYVDGEKRYILHPKGLTRGRHDRERHRCRHQARQRPAAVVHPRRYARPRRRAAARPVAPRIARSAGTSIQLMGKEGKYAILRMPSSEMRRVLLTCRATIGEVGNAEHSNINDRQGRPQSLEVASARPSAVPS